MRKVLTLVLIAAMACGDDSSTAVQPSIAGNWALTRLNGAALPFTISQTGTDKLELVSDALILTAAGTFSQSTAFRSTQNGQVTTHTESDAGTYTVSGTAVTLHLNSDGSTTTGAWSGNTLTITDQDFAAVYQRVETQLGASQDRRARR